MEKTKNYEGNYAKILDQLLSGKTITTMSVLRSVRMSELRVYIARIRKVLKVDDRWVKTENGQYKEYFIKAMQN